MYEDSIYQVSSSCSGEFGGTIKFLNKLTQEEHVATSTCPISVNKLNDRYYVTNSLAHMIGSTQILEIENPDSLEIFTMPKPYKKKGKIMSFSIGDNESKSTKGTIEILDSVGIMTQKSFVYKDELYSIIIGNKGSYLAKLQNGNYVNLITIYEDSMWNYSNKIIETKDRKIIVYIFSNEKKNLTSYFLIDDGKIYHHKFTTK